MRDTSYYVNMIDRFMSGWGPVKDGRSIFCIRCATETQARAAFAAAALRKEMVNVRMGRRPRRARKTDHLKVVDFHTLGPVWKYHLPKELV